MMELLTNGPRSPWTIFDEFESLQRHEPDFIRSGGPRFGRRLRAVYPPMNVWSSADGLVIDAGCRAWTPGTSKSPWTATC